VTAQRVCRVDEMPARGARGFRFGSGAELRAVLVVRQDDTLYAYVNSCPHLGTPLDFLPDRFFARDGDHLLCGTHGALFRPEDGLCIRGPCAGKRLTPAPTAIEDGIIVLTLTPPGNS